jgi:hypothetical protein
LTRIDPATLGPLPFLGGVRAPVGPRLLDPSPLVRRADRADTIEIRSVQPALIPTNASPTSVDRLVAAAVPAAAVPGPVVPVASNSAAQRALRLYANPGDQNAAATLGAAGRRLDVTA